MAARRGRPRGAAPPSSTTSTAARSGSSSATAASASRRPRTSPSCRTCASGSSSSRSTRAEPYERFARETERVRDELRALLERLRDEGKKVHVYGASTKGNTILQYIDASTDLIESAADRNPEKWGSETIGTGIPIISEEDSRAMKPDYYLALPWHFLDEFLEREKDFLARGGKFIVPLPEVHEVDGSGRSAPVAQAVTAG